MPDSFFDWLTVCPAGVRRDDVGAGGRGAGASATTTLTAAVDCVLAARADSSRRGARRADRPDDASHSFDARVSITNLGTRVIPAWELSFELPADIVQIWDARHIGERGGRHVVANSSGNAAIGPLKTVSFRFSGVARPGLAAGGADDRDSLPKPTNYRLNGVGLSGRWRDPVGLALRAQLGRLLNTRRAPLSPPPEGTAGATSGDEPPREGAGALGRDDRLLTYGFEQPARVAVTEHQDLAHLQSSVRACILRHIPWARDADVIATGGGYGAGRARVPVQVRVRTTGDNASLDLTLDRLARDVEITDPGL